MKIHLNYFILSLCVLVLFTLTLRVEATNYYVDGLNGNDSNNGLTPATAWKTLSRISGYSTPFVAGDVIAIRDSLRYEGGIYATDAGTDANRITYTNWYGSASGRLPVIKGSHTITGWTVYSGNVWKASYTPSTGQVNQVWYEADEDDPTQTVWGDGQTSLGNVTSDGDWYWESNVLYMYSTSDPDTRYDYVEAECQTDWNKIFVILAQGDYCTFRYLDIRYGEKGGLRFGNSNYRGGTAEYCKTSFTGQKNTESAHGIESYNGVDIIIRGNTCWENMNHGIYVFNNSGSVTSTNILIDSNYVYDNKHSQIDVNTNGGHIDFVVISHNMLENKVGNWMYTEQDKDPDGFFLAGQNGGSTRRIYLFNNVVKNIRAGGIDFDDSDIDSVYIYNNTFYDDATTDPSSGHRMVSIYNPSAHVWFKNNIIYSTYGRGLLRIYHMTNKVVDYNQYYWNGSVTVPFYGTSGITTWAGWLNYTSQETNSYNSDPNFVNAPSDLSLSTPSNGIDNGYTISAVTNDYVGTSRPQGSGYDIGAYEFMSGGGGGGNNPPNQPSNPSPANGATNQSINTTLAWSCSDPDGDPLTYDVYFGTSSSPPLASGNQANANYNPGQLNNNTTYYWKIAAKDNQGGSTTGPVWSFTTETSGSINNPPTEPSNPGPANGATNQSINTTLSWNCSDPDGDPLTYDIYFGTSNNPPFAAGNQTNTSYDPGQLDYSATYYWKIVAKDNQGASTTGPLWSFSTEVSGGDTTLVTVKIKAYLDGPYTDDAMSTDLSNNSLVPSEQPYNTQPWNYAGDENVSTVPQNIVDWILIELRSGTGASTVVARRAAFLRYDGIAVDINGQTKISFPGTQSGLYYIVIRHRNHLAVMSKHQVFLTDSSSVYDFTSSENQAYGDQPLKSLGNGKYGLYAADGNSNGNVNNSDYAGVWKKQNGSLGYEDGDFDLNGGVNIVDRNEKWKPNKGQSTQVPE